MTEEFKKLIDEQKSLFEAFKAENDKLIASGKNTLKESNEKLEAMSNRLDELDVKLQRHPAMGGSQPTPEQQAELDVKKKNRAFLEYCRYGLDGIDPELKSFLVKADAVRERKAIGTAQGVEFLASPEVTNELIKSVVEFSPIRSVARVRATSATSVKIRKRTGTFAAQWIGKTGTKTETAGLGYGMDEIPNHELYAMVDLSTQDLEDSDFNLEAELNMEFTEQFGVAEGKSALLGDASGEMEGIVTHAGLQAAAVNSGNASALTADGLIELTYALKDAYARNAAYLLKRSSIAAIRKLKGTDNNYLWQPGLSENVPANILGRPYVEAVDMPAVAANAFAIAFGDFRRGYTIVDRVSVSVLRDPYSVSTGGMVRFIARKRVGGQVVNTEAIKLMKVAA